MNKLDSVFIIGATNYLERLEEGSIRNGRFNMRYEIGNPNYETRKTIIASYLQEGKINSRASLWINFLMCGHSCVDIKKFIEKIKDLPDIIEDCKKIFKQELLKKIDFQNEAEYEKRKKNIEAYIDKVEVFQDEEFIEEIKKCDLTLGLTAITDNRISILFPIPELSLYKHGNNDIMNNFNNFMSQQEKFLVFVEKKLTETGEAMRLEHEALHSKFSDQVDDFACTVQNKAQKFLATTKTDVEAKIKELDAKQAKIMRINED